MQKHKKIYIPISVDERLPKSFATIHVVLLDGRLPMMAQWRPGLNSNGEWWTLGMSNGSHIEENKKCVTHWLEVVQNVTVLTEQEIEKELIEAFMDVPETAYLGTGELKNKNSGI